MLLKGLALGAVILTLVMATAIAAGATPLQQEDAGARRFGVVLFGADWCAPCLREKTRLGELTRAGAPLPVRMHWFSSPTEASPELARHGIKMLPVAIAYDRHGRICGRRQGLLGTRQLRSWARRCVHT